MATAANIVVTPVETPPPAAPPAPTAPGLVDGRVAEERVSVASQWQLMWWRFRKHRLAYADPYASEGQRTLLPPQAIHLFDDGRFAPFVYGIKGERDLTTFKRVYVEDTSRKLYVRPFATGFDYKLLGFIPTNMHLIGLDGAPTETNLFLLGGDLQGRDL